MKQNSAQQKNRIMFSGPLSSRWIASLKKLTSKLSDVKQNPASVKLAAGCLSGSICTRSEGSLCREVRCLNPNIPYSMSGAHAAGICQTNTPIRQIPANARTDAATQTGRLVPMYITFKKAFPNDN